jgi:oligosaccharide repeat unit polymerase
MKMKRPKTQAPAAVPQDMPESHEPVEQKSLWWLSPMWLLLLFIMPIYGLITQVGNVSSKDLTIRALRFLDDYYLLLGFGMLLALVVGAWVGSQIKASSRPTSIVDGRWEWALWMLGLASLMAYIVWFKDIIFVPSVLIGMLMGEARLSRAEIGTTIGVTSLTNFIPIYFSLVTYVWLHYGDRLSKSLKWLTGVLFVLTLFRVYAWAERLALIELMAGVVVPTCLALHNSPKRPFLRKVLLIAPFLGIPLLLLYFGAFEYFRSWQSNFYNGKTDFWSFVVGRVGAYYYTALNNGAGMLSTAPWPTYKFEHVLTWVHKAPFGIGPMFKYYIGLKTFAGGQFLVNYGDPEFNNPSGIFTIIFDIGIPGAICYFFLFGYLAGYLYRGYVAGNTAAILFYPLFFIAILEIMRVPYLGDSRIFTAVLGGVVAYWLIQKRQRRAGFA